MSSANVDLARSIYADWERGDYGSSEWGGSRDRVRVRSGPTPGRSSGIAAMSAAWQDFLRAWERFRSGAADEYSELDSERVLVLAEFSAQGKASGLQLDQAWKRGVSVFHVRDGKVTRLLLYFDADRALADLGLAPGAG